MTVANAAAQVGAAAPNLPLAHTTRWNDFEEMLSSNWVDVLSRCPRNGSPTCYFFYGFPAYILPLRHSHQISVTEADEHPVGLIFDHNAASANADVYPFDTGALRKGQYEPYFVRTEILDDFVVETDKAQESAAKLVTIFFGSNSHYATGPGTADPDLRNRYPVVDRVATLHSAKIKADVRRRAIEVMIKGKVAIGPYLRAVIVPGDHFHERRNHVPRLEELHSDGQVEVIEYPVQYPFSPESDSAVILREGLRYLKAKGLV